VVELDSVGSAANRLEEVLLDLHRNGQYPLPVSSTTLEPKGAEKITVTTLEMPHRVFDAWLRLSAPVDGGEGKFEDSPQGKELSMAHAGALDALLETSAHDLLFGVWDSHRKGPHGQVRIARSITTTLIGLDPIEQAQVAARRDPLNLGDGSGLPKGEKKLSEQGLSSIPPQKRVPYAKAEANSRVESFNGGVAISRARYLGFLSFAGLRRLGFQRYDSVEARMLLAALGLYALALRASAGWDLRARCVLTPIGDLQLTMAGPQDARETFALPIAEAEQLFRDAVQRVGIDDRSVQLMAGPTLNGYVEKAVAAGQSSA
jgi:CRISPR-associated protein Csb1